MIKMHLVICVGLSWWMTSVGGQRAPCYQCEMYKDSHPHSHPYSAVRAHCVYPCSCGSVPQCPTGVPVIRDGCGCCWQCAKIAGESCDGVDLCDTSRYLSCHYKTAADASGICKEMLDSRCRVNGRTYEDGQAFTIDCRTQCTCQNGTYACVSLCPGESIPPSSQCHHPHLVNIPGQCCREWMCDTAPNKAIEPPNCAREAGPWSPCSVQTCGVGVSVRWSTDNSNCQVLNETRLCQLRPCRQESENRGIQQIHNEVLHSSRKHHIRRGHTCKATQKVHHAVRLQVGWCISERRYRPKECGSCTDRCCTVFSSTTITVAFLCPLHSNTDLLAARRSHQLNDLLAKSRIDGPETVVMTTRTPSVYDMMDEGQPILHEQFILDTDQQHGTEQHQQPASDEAFLYNYPEYSERSNSNQHDLGDDNQPNHHESEEDLLFILSGGNENLTVDDDTTYERIKTDNYKIVHHRVQWILRCKCKNTCHDLNTHKRNRSIKQV